MRNVLLVVLTIFLVTLVGCATADKSMVEKDAMEKKAMEDKAMAEKEAMHKDAIVKEDKTIEKDENNVAMDKSKEAMSKEGTFIAKGKILAGTTTPYIDYNKEDYEKALTEGKIVVLYFYANWCPICRVEQISTFGALMN